MGRIFLLVLYATSYSSGTPLETRRSAASGPNDPASSPSRADLGSVRQRPPVWPVRSKPRAGAGRLSDSQDPGEAGSPGACIYCLPRNHTQHSFNLSSCPSAPERPDGLKLPHRALLLSTYLITFIYLSSVNSSANSGGSRRSQLRRLSGSPKPRRQVWCAATAPAVLLGTVDGSCVAFSCTQGELAECLLYAGRWEMLRDTALHFLFQVLFSTVTHIFCVSV